MPLDRSPRTVLVLFALILLGCRGDAFCQSPPADATPSETAVSARAPSDSGGAIASSASATPTGGFFQRLAKAYKDDWKQLPSSDAVPAFRSTPSPVEGPPFPFSDWPYGGSVVITKPWTQSAPLMQALWS